MTIKNSEIILTDEEQQAVSKAHDIIVERFAAAGISYGYHVREQVGWVLLGALHTGGIDGMMRYAKEAPINRKLQKGRAAV